MTASDERYEVYAIKYAHRVAPRHVMFLRDVERPDEPIGMDYFTWIAISPQRVIAIDTGFTQSTSVRMKRDYIASPIETMKRFGYDAKDVQDVILTHLHYDHCGNTDQFPNARVHVQREEMAYWFGPYAGRGGHDQPVHDFTYLVEANLEGRVRWIDGDAEVAPGITAHLVRGHTAGMQCVRVATKDGHIVLASDVSHYYENIMQDRPFRTLHTVPLVYAAFDRVKELAGDPSLIVPGHDPLVCERYPAASKDFEGLVYRLA